MPESRLRSGGGRMGVLFSHYLLPHLGPAFSSYIRFRVFLNHRSHYQQRRSWMCVLSHTKNLVSVVYLKNEGMFQLANSGVVRPALTGSCRQIGRCRGPGRRRYLGHTVKSAPVAAPFPESTMRFHNYVRTTMSSRYAKPHRMWNPKFCYLFGTFIFNKSSFCWYWKA